MVGVGRRMSEQVARSRQPCDSPGDIPQAQEEWMQSPPCWGQERQARLEGEPARGGGGGGLSKLGEGGRGSGCAGSGAWSLVRSLKQ